MIFYLLLHQLLRTEPAGTQCVWKRIEYRCTWLTAVSNLHMKETTFSEHLSQVSAIGTGPTQMSAPFRSSHSRSGLTVEVLILLDNVLVPYHWLELSDLSLILTDSLSHEHWHFPRNSFNAKVFASTNSYSWWQMYLGIWMDPWKGLLKWVTPDVFLLLFLLLCLELI